MVHGGRSVTNNDSAENTSTMFFLPHESLITAIGIIKTRVKTSVNPVD